MASMALVSNAYADPEVPKALDLALKSGMKIDKTFAAADGLTGWVLSTADRTKAPSIVYTTADGNYLFAGALIDSTGANLTNEYAQAQIPKPDHTGLFAKLDKTAYVAEGSKNPKRIVYAFSDPNCPFCDLMWRAVQPYEQEGLQVRWIQVGFLRPDSAGKAAALLQAKDAESAMKVNETNFDFPGEEGGIAAIPVTPAMQASLKANEALMQEFGFSGTPAMVYKDVKTGEVKTNAGMPRPSTLSEEFGLPAVPVTDPMLTRFH